MKVQELRKKSRDELLKILAELKEETRSLRFRIASREIKNHQLLRLARKDIARILTILNKEDESSSKA